MQIKNGRHEITEVSMYSSIIEIETGDGIDTQYLYTTSSHVSYRIQNERCIIIISSALFQTEA